MNLFDIMYKIFIQPSLKNHVALSDEKVLLKTNPLHEFHFGDSEIIDEIPMSENDLIVHLIEKRYRKKPPKRRCIYEGEFNEIKGIARERRKS